MTEIRRPALHDTPDADEFEADDGLLDGLATPPELLLQRKDLREAARSLTAAEARYLVDLYYARQADRIAAGNQVAALSKASEPHAAIAYVQATMLRLEKDISSMLDAYTRTEATGMGAWARSVTGVGPVLAAGLLAHLDITRAQTVGAWWRFGGLDPTVVWERGQKRPWNASLKLIYWKLGMSFQKTCNRPTDVYGHLYVQRKAYEQARNERGELADQAAAALKKLRKEDTVAKKAYLQGKLPPGHIDARARRYAVKQFLADYHAVAYEKHHGTPPPLPYPISHLGHVHLDDRTGVYARGGVAPVS
jgi:hypothetical protein